MSDHAIPSHGQEYGPCGICGKTALPKYGVYHCSKHASWRHAKRVKDDG